MTVRDLIEQLQQLDNHLEIETYDIEGCLTNDVDVEVWTNRDNPWVNETSIRDWVMIKGSTW